MTSISDLREALDTNDRLRKAIHTYFNADPERLDGGRWLATAFSNAQYDEGCGIANIVIDDDGTITATAEVYTTQTGGSHEYITLRCRLSNLELREV